MIDCFLLVRNRKQNKMSDDSPVVNRPMVDVGRGTSLDARRLFRVW